METYFELGVELLDADKRPLEHIEHEIETDFETAKNIYDSWSITNNTAKYFFIVINGEQKELCSCGYTMHNEIKTENKKLADEVAVLIDWADELGENETLQSFSEQVLTCINNPQEENLEWLYSEVIDPISNIDNKTEYEADILYRLQLAIAQTGKEKLKIKLEHFCIIDNEIGEEHAKCFITTFCLEHDIMPDTANWDTLIDYLWANVWSIYSTKFKNKNDFDLFMGDFLS